MMNYYERMNWIAEGLKHEGIEYKIESHLDGCIMTFPWCDGDIACHRYTYGATDGRVETYQFPWDAKDGVSCLTIYNAVRRIANYYYRLENQ